MKDMNIVSFLLFLWNRISSLFFPEFNLFPPGVLLAKIFTLGNFFMEMPGFPGEFFVIVGLPEFLGIRGSEYFLINVCKRTFVWFVSYL